MGDEFGKRQSPHLDEAEEEEAEDELKSEMSDEGKSSKAQAYLMLLLFVIGSGDETGEQEFRRRKYVLRVHYLPVLFSFSTEGFPPICQSNLHCQSCARKTCSVQAGRRRRTRSGSVRKVRVMTCHIGNSGF